MFRDSDSKSARAGLFSIVFLWALVPALAADAQSKKSDKLDINVGTFSLAGKIKEYDEESRSYVFKSDGKTLNVYIPASVGLVTHEVKRLTDLSEGTELTIFAKRILWDEGTYQMEAITVMVAGDYAKPLFLETDRKKPRWHSGKLSYQADKNRVYIGDDQMHVGKGRKVVVATRGKLGDIENYFGKNIIVRGMYSKDKGNKARFVMVLDVILPTKGMPSKEYNIVLFPEKLKPAKPLGG